MPDVLMLVAGLVLLIGGAEALVGGASSLAGRLGLSAGAIGLTVVAWGTSFPELVVSVESAGRGLPDVALGNVVGSNIYNVVLILGVAGLISGLNAERRTFWLDLPVMFAAMLALVAASLDGVLDQVEGGLFLVALVAFTAYLLRSAAAGASGDDEEVPRWSSPVSLVAIVAGIGLLGLGARWFTGGAVSLAESLGVSERVIGLTLVALGTSLPELFTSVVAAVRGKADIAVSNVVGSNIMNVFGILGATSLISPIRVNAAIASWDYGCMLGVSALVFVLLLTGSRLARWEGAVLLVVGAAYTSSLW